MNKTVKLHRLIDIAKLAADATDIKSLPTEIQLMAAGNFRTIKGDFALGPQEFDEAVANFNRGVARVGKTAGLPINFNHEQSGPAAGWINGLENRGIEGLWGTGIEWSTLGAEQIIGAVYKFFSIEYWFQYYEEPDDAGVFYNNVVEGGAMTNIPLMRGLTPVMADKSITGLTSSSISNTIYIEQGETPVNLEQLKLKANSELSTEERKFLADHKDQLTADEQVKFGLVADKDAEKAEAEKVAAEKIAADKIAADKAATTDGKITLSKDEADKLRADAERGRLAADKLERKEIGDSLAAHVKRGAIKPDSVEGWTEILMSASAEARTKIEEQLTGLGDNAVVASKEVGGDGVTSTSTAQVELHTRTLEQVKASNSTIKYADAQKNLLAADKALADRVNEEREALNSN